MAAPRYQDIAPDKIPVVEFGDGVQIKVIAGEVGGIKGPVTAVATQSVYLDIGLQPGAAYSTALPLEHNAFIYVYAGAAHIGIPPQRSALGEFAVLGSGESVIFTAVNEASMRRLLVTSQLLEEPIIYYRL